MCDYFYLRCSITIRGIIDFHIFIYYFLKHRHGMWLVKNNSCALLKIILWKFLHSFQVLSSCVISNFPSDFTKNMLQTREKAKLFLLFLCSVVEHFSVQSFNMLNIIQKKLLSTWKDALRAIAKTEHECQLNPLHFSRLWLQISALTPRNRERIVSISINLYKQ